MGSFYSVKGRGDRKHAGIDGGSTVSTTGIERYRSLRGGIPVETKKKSKNNRD